MASAIVKILVGILILAVLSAIGVIFFFDEDHELLAKLSVGVKNEDAEEALMIVELRERLQPKDVAIVNEETSELALHQFLHMHHMKTGGTSMDQRLSCARNRLIKDRELDIPYGNIHECSGDRYYTCRDGNNPQCSDRLAAASFMSFCAPLKDLNAFEWDSSKDNINAITVLRDPVDRVWSMFRFQTKGCYKCMNLTDIYDMIDSGETEEFGDLCVKQLQNHETANLLSTEWPDDATDQEMIDQAVDNMKGFFTAIGLTEQLDETVEIFGEIFPWFKVEVDWSNTTCPLNHANKSPSNNRCLPGNKHWDLPKHPDEETRRAIEEHNKLDIELYKAAVKHFELQKQAVLGEE